MAGILSLANSCVAVQPVDNGTDADTAMAVMRLIESGVDTSAASKMVLGQMSHNRR